MPDRDPLIDPQADDLVRGVSELGTVITLHVHAVANGKVYMGRYWGGNEPGVLVQVSLEQWREECRANAAVVIPRGAADA